MNLKTERHDIDMTQFISIYPHVVYLCQISTTHQNTNGWPHRSAPLGHPDSRGISTSTWLRTEKSFAKWALLRSFDPESNSDKYMVYPLVNIQKAMAAMENHHF
jgi:hypothetical protein